jgi:hypothetical protein
MYIGQFLKLLTFDDGQLLTAINHHRSLDERKVLFPMQRYFALSCSSRMTWHSADRDAEVRLII